MPSFVAGSFAVAGVIAAAAPFLIHLLNRRRYRVVQWAAMDLLREAMTRNRKFLHLRDLLLLALRTLCVLVFALALARPVFTPASGAGDANQPVHAVLLVDNSLSMGYQRLSGTLLDEAKRQLNEFLEQLPLGSRISVLPLCGSSNVYSQDVYRTISDARGALARIEVVDRSAAFSAAIDLATEACAAAPDVPNKRVILIGDQQRINWPSGRLDEALGRIPDLQIVQVAPEAASANAWIADFHVQDEIAGVDAPVVFTATIRYEGPAPRRDVEAALMVNGVRVAAQTVDLEPEQSRQVRFQHEFDVPVEPGEIASVIASLSLSPDQLPADDERFLAVPVVSSLPVLFIDQYGAGGEDPPTNRYGETFHLRRLLAPVASRSDTARQLVFVRHATADQVEREHLEDCRLVVIAGLEGPAHLVPLLREYVEQGGELLIAAGGAFDPQAWSKAAWLEGAGVLPLPLRGDPIGHLPEESAAQLKPFFLSPESMTGKEFQIEDASREELADLYRAPLFFKAVAVDNSDDVLASLREADIERISAARKRRAETGDEEGQPDASLGAQDEGAEASWLLWGNASLDNGFDESPERLADLQRPRVLASFSNGAPFLVSRQIGRGQVVFVTSGVMTGWNNLTRTNAVVLLDRLLHGMLARTLPRRNFGTDDRAVIPVAAAERRDNFVLERPGGARETLFVDATPGDRFSVTLARLTQRGRYQLLAERLTTEPSTTPGDGSRARMPQMDRLWQLELAVDGPAEESELEPARAADLKDRFGKTAVRWVAPGESIHLEGARVQGQETWRWLMAAALGCVLVEMLLLAISNAATQAKSAGPKPAAAGVTRAGIASVPARSEAAGTLGMTR